MIGAPPAKAPLEDAIRAKCAAVADMLVEKNRAYGNSALDPVRVFARDLDPLAQIRVRMDDKLSRIARGHSAGEDPYVDLVGYLILLLIGNDRAQAEFRGTGADRG